MTFTVTLPELGVNKGSSTKDLIIQILSEEWPLTAKQLFNRVSKQAGTKVTYQAVHKMLSLLVKEDILTKQGTSYLLAKNWIEQIKKFSDNLSVIYSEEKKIPANYDFEKPVFLTFENLSEVARFIIYDFHGALPNPPKRPALCLWTHHWPLIGLSDKEYTYISELFKCRNYFALTKSNTPLDRLFGGILEKLGKQSRAGINFSAQHDTFVHDDIICQVFFPTELTNQLDKTYNTVENINTENLNDIFKELISKEAKINAIIFKSPELADKLREETMAYFKEIKE